MAVPPFRPETPAFTFQIGNVEFRLSWRKPFIDWLNLVRREVNGASDDALLAALTALGDSQPAALREWILGVLGLEDRSRAIGEELPFLIAAEKTGTADVLPAEADRSRPIEELAYLLVGERNPTAFGIIYDTAANRASYPAAQFDGRMYVDSDTGERWISTGGQWVDGDLLVSGNLKWKAGTGFTARLLHAITANRDYTFPDANGNIPYETAALTLNNFLFGGGGQLLKDAGFAIVPVANGGTGVDNTTQTYTPTLTGVANISALTAHPAQYMRVGNVVVVSSYLDLTPTASGVDTQIRISLPIASNIAQAYQCGGTGAAVQFTESGGIYGDAANHAALLEFISATAGAHSIVYQFAYQVV